MAELIHNPGKYSVIVVCLTTPVNAILKSLKGRMVPLPEKYSINPEGEIYSQIRPLVYGMALFLQGKIEQAEKIYNAYSKAPPGNVNKLVRIIALIKTGDIAWLRGSPRQAYVFYMEAVDASRNSRGGLMPAAGRALIGIGEILTERNELTKERYYLETGIDVVRQWGEIGSLGGYIALARLFQTTGDREEAEHSLFRAKTIAKDFDAKEMDDYLVLLCEAKIRLLDGDLEYVEEWLSNRDRRDKYENQHMSKYEYPLVVGYYLAKEQIQKARDRVKNIPPVENPQAVR